MSKKKNLKKLLLPVLGLLVCVFFYFGLWTYSPLPHITPLSEMDDQTCTLGDIEAALMQELRTGNGPSYRIGTIRFTMYAHEQAEGAVKDQRLVESENYERYQLYLTHYIAAENAFVGERFPYPFWRDMRDVTVAQLKTYGMAAIWSE